MNDDGLPIECQLELLPDRAFMLDDEVAAARRELEAARGQRRKREAAQKPVMDLRNFIGPMGIKFYCWFCELEYATLDVKNWWNSKKKTIPICPGCGLTGGALGWPSEKKGV